MFEQESQIWSTHMLHYGFFVNDLNKQNKSLSTHVVFGILLNTRSYIRHMLFNTNGESETWSQSPWVSSVSRSTRTAVMWETGLAAAVGEAAVVSGRSGPPATESVDIRRSRAKQGRWKLYRHIVIVHFSPVLEDPDPYVLGPPGSRSGSINERSLFS